MRRPRVPWTPRAGLASVRVRVTLAAVLVGVVGGLVGSGLFLRALHENLERSLVEAAGQEAATMTAQLAAGRSPSSVVVSGHGQDRFLQVLDARGRVLAADHASLRTTAAAPTPVAAPSIREGVQVPGLDDTFVVLARPVAQGRTVVVGLSEEQRFEATRTAVRLLAVALPAALLLLALVVWVSVGRALAPVEVMRREAEEISSAHLHRRLQVPGGDDEIPHLARTLNEMLDRVDASQRAQRRFVSDASHELRSPLATLRQLVEVAGRHPDGAAVAALAAEVGAEQQRMQDLVTALLTLARLDDGGELRRVVVDLDDLVLLEAARVRRDGLAVDLAGVSGGQVTGDAVLLGQVVANLLANAARHAAGTVRVRLSQDDAGVLLAVEDDGAGIAPCDRARVFERFARLDDARDRDSGGAGLGLAIVDTVVAAHGGAVSVDRSALGGARFEVRLPAAPEGAPPRSWDRAV